MIVEGATDFTTYVALGIGLPAALGLVGLSIYLRLRLPSLLWFVAAQVLALLTGGVRAFLAYWAGTQVRAAIRDRLSGEALAQVCRECGARGQWIQPVLAVLICATMLTFVILLAREIRLLKASTPAAE